jgi:trimethylamine--corrinoid protein Co-methyltransferase
MVSGSENNLRAKPFLIGTSSALTPLILTKDVIEKNLLCADKGIPNILSTGPMAGATAPVTFAGAIVIANAESLSQLVISQLKKPGAPCIFGAVTTIMDMKTMIFSYGAPELSLMVAALTEMSRFYKLPMFSTAGCTDAEIAGAQAGAEITSQVMLSALSGADLIHDVGITHHSAMISPEIMVLTNEIIDMVKVLMNGIEINEETLPLDLIEHVGPGGNYISEAHTLKHFQKFWMPTIFDRSLTKGGKHCEEMLNEKTIKILDTHKPKPLPDDLVKELKKLEKTWFDEVGLKYEYPARK